MLKGIISVLALSMIVLTLAGCPKGDDAGAGGDAGGTATDTAGDAGGE